MEEIEQQLLSIDNEQNLQPTPHESIDIESKLNRIQERTIRYSNLMTMHEKCLMAKIQLKQLSSGNKYFDDYYSSMLHQRNIPSVAGDSNVKLPTFTRRAAPKMKRSLVSLDTALGKASMSSVRVPRKIHRVSRETEFSIQTGTAMHLRVLNKIESLYLAVLGIEELEYKHHDHGMENFQEALNKLKSGIIHELSLDSQVSMNKEQLLGMIQFLNYEKGQKIIKRICPYLSDEQQVILLERIITCLKYLDIINASFTGKLVQKLNLFINNAIIPFVDTIVTRNNEENIRIIHNLLDSSVAIQHLSNKVCLVLFCILLNALESAKDRNSALTSKCADLIF